MSNPTDHSIGYKHNAYRYQAVVQQLLSTCGEQHTKTYDQTVEIKFRRTQRRNKNNSRQQQRPPPHEGR